MDYESADARAKGCWDPKTLLAPFYDNWCSPTPTPEFVVDDVWCGMVASLGFGAAAAESLKQFWVDTCKSTYSGDEGRKKLKMALGCLLDRDGLLRRLRDVTCPVYWLQVCPASSPLRCRMLTRNRELRTLPSA
jgi:microsomal epoxide hydrolase